MTDAEVDPNEVVPWDGRCHECDGVHIIRARRCREPGDTVKFAHTKGPGACGEAAKHTLVSRLDGLYRESPAWGGGLDA